MRARLKYLASFVLDVPRALRALVQHGGQENRRSRRTEVLFTDLVFAWSKLTQLEFLPDPRLEFDPFGADFL